VGKEYTELLQGEYLQLADDLVRAVNRAENHSITRQRTKTQPDYKLGGYNWKSHGSAASSVPALTADQCFRRFVLFGTSATSNSAAENQPEPEKQPSAWSIL
jgi:hypothetical protein